MPLKTLSFIQNNTQFFENISFLNALTFLLFPTLPPSPFKSLQKIFLKNRNTSKSHRHASDILSLSF